MAKEYSYSPPHTYFTNEQLPLLRGAWSNPSLNKYRNENKSHLDFSWDILNLSGPRKLV